MQPTPPYRLPATAAYIMEIMVCIWSAIEILMIFAPTAAAPIPSEDILANRIIALGCLFLTQLFPSEKEFAASAALSDQVLGPDPVDKAKAFKALIELITIVVMGISFYKVWSSTIGSHPGFSIIVYLLIGLWVQMRYFKWDELRDA